MPLICLVGRDARVFTKDGISSHIELAKIFEIDRLQYAAYRLDLQTRTVQRFLPFVTPERSHLIEDTLFTEQLKAIEKAVLQHFEECARTAEKLIDFALRGNFSGYEESDFLDLLTLQATEAYHANTEEFKQVFYDINAEAWQAYESSDKSEEEAHQIYKKISTESLKNYYKSAIHIWVELFRNPKNRIAIWRE